MDAKPLIEAGEGEQYIVSRVKDQGPQLLRYLEKIGLLPGVKVEIKEKAPFEGPLTLLLEGNEKVIGNDIAKNIFVAEM